MKKVVVSLLVVMMAVAFSMTGVVSAQTCPATTTSCATTTACPATTCAQSTSCATSACCCPCPVTCPVVTCPTPCPVVVACVVTVKCSEFQTVVVKEEVKPVFKKEAEKMAAEFEKGAFQSPKTVVENKVTQSNTNKPTATITIGKDAYIDGDVKIIQTNEQDNKVKTDVSNTNVNIPVNIKDVSITSATKGGQIGDNTEIEDSHNTKDVDVNAATG